VTSDKDYSSLNRFPVLLRGVWFGLNKKFRKKLNEVKLTTAQYTTLRCIYENSGVNQFELAKLINTNKNNTSCLVERLLKRGLIEREHKPRDRRSFQLSLTSYGNEVFSIAKTYAEDLKNDVGLNINSISEAGLIEYLTRCTSNIAKH